MGIFQGRAGKNAPSRLLHQQAEGAEAVILDLPWSEGRSSPFFAARVLRLARGAWPTRRLDTLRHELTCNRPDSIRSPGRMPVLWWAPFGRTAAPPPARIDPV